MPFAGALAGGLYGYSHGNVLKPLAYGLLAGIVIQAVLLRYARNPAAERSHWLSADTMRRLLKNDYAKTTDVFLVLEPPDMVLTDEQQLAIQTAADDLRHYEDPRLAIIFSSGPFGTIALIRKSAILEVQSAPDKTHVRNFAELLEAFQRIGYTSQQR